MAHSSPPKKITLVSSSGGEDSWNIRHSLLKQWDVTTGRTLQTISHNHLGTISPNGQFLIGIENRFVSGLQPNKRNINIINAHTGQLIKSFPGTATALSQDGKILAISEDDQSLKLFYCPSGKYITTLPGPFQHFTLSADGKTLALSYGETIKLWQDSTEPIVKQFLQGDAHPHLKRLEILLAAEQWEDANQETADLIKRFPSKDLNRIDQLWVHYSHENYGFSVQRTIWESVVRKEGRRVTINERPLNDIDQFEYSVGWLTIESNPFILHDNDEGFKKAYKKTKKGYYPRLVNQEDSLEIISRLSLTNKEEQEVDLIQQPNTSLGKDVVKEEQEVDLTVRPNHSIVQPNASQVKDAVFSLLVPDNNYGTIEDIHLYAWTQSGQLNVNRVAIEFDLSLIPQDAIIHQALLSLYFNPTSRYGNSHKGNNAFYIQRIISPWEENTVTWKTQPQATTINQVSVPRTTVSNQDLTNINVTNLVKDMIHERANSFGFLLNLQHETPYTILLLASSDHRNIDLHPQLEIKYSIRK